MECTWCEGTGYIKNKRKLSPTVKTILRILLLLAGIALFMAILSMAEHIKIKLLYLIPLVVLFLCLEFEIIPEFIIQALENKHKIPCPHCTKT
jgi:ABC-type multidrug transport system permease subunit